MYDVKQLLLVFIYLFIKLKFDTQFYKKIGILKLICIFVGKQQKLMRF